MSRHAQGKVIFIVNYLRLWYNGSGQNIYSANKSVRRPEVKTRCISIQGQLKQLSTLDVQLCACIVNVKWKKNVASITTVWCLKQTSWKVDTRKNQKMILHSPFETFCLVKLELHAWYGQLMLQYFYDNRCPERVSFTDAVKVAEHSFRARYCWCDSARAQGLQNQKCRQ